MNVSKFGVFGSIKKVEEDKENSKGSKERE